MEPTAAATAPEPPKRESFPVALVRLVRVKHWLKNVFVLAPALFSERIFERAGRSDRADSNSRTVRGIGDAVVAPSPIVTRNHLDRVPMPTYERESNSRPFWP